MIGKRTIVAILVSVVMAVVPFTTTAGDETCEVLDYSKPGYDFWYPEPGHFDYSEGQATGQYLQFKINESTGMVTDYTVTLTTYDAFYPLLIYEECYSVDESGEIYIDEKFPEYNWTYENVTIFDSIQVEGFTPVGHPGTFADLFVFQGENVLMMFYDRDWTQGYYASSDLNNTIIFEVAEGFKVYEFPYWDYKWDETGYEEEPREDPDYPDEYCWELTWKEIWIENENSTTTIIVNNGNATIDNNTITVELNANSYLDINTWAIIEYFPIFDKIWYPELEYDYEMELIEMAREAGLIAGEGWYFEYDEEYQGYDKDLVENWGNSEYYSYNDPTFSMEFIYIEEDWIKIEIDSDIPEGRIVMVNLNDEALETKSIDDMLVKLDGEKIKHTESLDELMGMVGGNEAGFFALIGEDGTTVFVYVPHFSTHTITIESILGSGGLLGTMGDILLPAVLAIAVIALAAVGILLKGRKNQEEY